MNFTREPVIETIITPKEGYKLTVRSSRSGSQEEYIVDAVEVVSFGHALFFRSEERPKAFLLPVAEYEVVETKETRVILKNAPLEGSIKIGGGKVSKPLKEGEDRPQTSAPRAEETHSEDRSKRRKGLSRRKRHAEAEGAQRGPVEARSQGPSEGASSSSEKKEEDAPVSSMMFRSLIPPPPGLISEKFQQEKLSQTPKPEVPPVKEESKAAEVEDSVGVSDFDDEGQKEETPRYHAAPPLED
ncbi:MAG: hypothetical protein FJZ63_03770 [Chlamydiae bacterium]|nr:hypothetical protein [Chlamydiota bacterium]